VPDDDVNDDIATEETSRLIEIASFETNKQTNVPPGCAEEAAEAALGAMYCGRFGTTDVCARTNECQTNKRKRKSTRNNVSNDVTSYRDENKKPGAACFGGGVDNIVDFDLLDIELVSILTQHNDKRVTLLTTTLRRKYNDS
jgi:hypothetical protein